MFFTYRRLVKLGSNYTSSINILFQIFYDQKPQNPLGELNSWKQLQSFQGHGAWRDAREACFLWLLLSHFIEIYDRFNCKY